MATKDTSGSPKASTSFLPPTSEIGGVSNPSTPVASSSHRPRPIIPSPTSPSTPVASSSHRPQPIIPSPTNPQFMDSLSSTPVQEELDSLKDFEIHVNTSYPYPRIEGLFPYMPEYIKEKSNTLVACFILGPEYQYSPKIGLVGNCYCSEEVIDLKDFEDIYNVSPDHIFQVQRKSSKEGKIRCCYNAWVSFPRLYLFF